MLRGTFVIMSPQSKYWGDVSPLSHMDRRPCLFVFCVCVEVLALASWESCLEAAKDKLVINLYDLFVFCVC